MNKTVQSKSSVEHADSFAQYRGQAAADARDGCRRRAAAVHIIRGFLGHLLSVNCVIGRTAEFLTLATCTLHKQDVGYVFSASELNA